jgi:hypothetical protein
MSSALDKNQIRIRNNTKITKLSIPQKKIDAVNKVILNPTYVSSKVINSTIKNMTGFSPCCICRVSIPAVVLTYSLGPMHGVVEYYCNSCLAKVYSRQQHEPADPSALADYYHCVRGSWKEEEKALSLPGHSLGG